MAIGLLCGRRSASLLTYARYIEYLCCRFLSARSVATSGSLPHHLRQLPHGQLSDTTAAPAPALDGGVHREEEPRVQRQARGRGAERRPDGDGAAGGIAGEGYEERLGGGRVGEEGPQGGEEEAAAQEYGVEEVAGQAGGGPGGRGQVVEDMGDELDGEGVHFVTGEGEGQPRVGEKGGEGRRGAKREDRERER